MKIRRWSAVALAAASIPAFATAASSWPWSRGTASPPAIAAAVNRAQSVIALWPEHSRELAEAVEQEYGPPDSAQPSQLSWTGKRPWRTIVVYRDALASDRPNGFSQSVSYDVPVRRWRPLGAFDRGVDYDPVNHELIAHTDSEISNFLALNLADEVIRGRRTAEDACEYFDRALSLSFAGKSSAYMRRLRFRPRNAPERSAVAAYFVPAETDMKSK